MFTLKFKILTSKVKDNSLIEIPDPQRSVKVVHTSTGKRVVEDQYSSNGRDQFSPEMMMFAVQKDVPPAGNTHNFSPEHINDIKNSGFSPPNLKLLEGVGSLLPLERRMFTLSKSHYIPRSFFQHQIGRTADS
jgi:hypothetical protein